MNNKIDSVVEKKSKRIRYHCEYCDTYIYNLKIHKMTKKHQKRLVSNSNEDMINIDKTIQPNESYKNHPNFRQVIENFIHAKELYRSFLIISIENKLQQKVVFKRNKMEMYNKYYKGRKTRIVLRIK